MTGRMSRAGGWAWVRVAVALSIIAGLLWRVGADAFLAGLRLVTWASVVTAAGLGLVTTLCCAWRWRLVSAGLGVPIPWRRAVGDYYRAQFLNLTLPGGVLGDVHRAVRHGQDAGDVGLGIRAVVLDRFAGQAVQAVIAVAVLCWLPSPVRDHMPVVAAGLLAAGLAALLFARLSPEDAPGRWRRMPRRLAGDVRLGLLAGGVWPGVLLASTVAVAGHLATFLL
ncbi:MAG TPA: lysylphosphatidylglycerol synthase transmembrane domain-containing protein, partial [Micromonosporaceae bacterium]